jgi:hypothetical protein
MYDRHGLPRLRNFAIPSNHVAIPIFYNVRDLLLKELRKTQIDYSITLVLRGRELHSAQPTILIICGNPESLVTKTKIPSSLRLVIMRGDNERFEDRVDLNFDLYGF